MSPSAIVIDWLPPKDVGTLGTPLTTVLQDSSLREVLIIKAEIGDIFAILMELMERFHRYESLRTQGQSARNKRRGISNEQSHQIRLRWNITQANHTYCLNESHCFESLVCPPQSLFNPSTSYFQVRLSSM